MTDQTDQNKHRISLYVSHTMYVKMCESSESQAVVVNRALEQYFSPPETLANDTQTQPENDHLHNDYLLQSARITDLTAKLEVKDVKFSELQDQIKAKDDLIKVNEAHHLNRIEDLKNNIYLLDNQLRTKDDQIEKLNENMHKQAVHIQSLIQENSKLNAKLLPENTEPKKPWWQFW